MGWKIVLDSINRIITPISFVISLVILFLSSKIKKEVDLALSRKSLHDELDSIDKQLSQVISKLSNPSSFQKSRLELFSTLGTIKSHYGDLGSEIASLCDELGRLLNSINSSQEFLNSVDLQKVSQKIGELKGALRKECDK